MVNAVVDNLIKVCLCLFLCCSFLCSDGRGTHFLLQLASLLWGLLLFNSLSFYTSRYIYTAPSIYRWLWREFAFVISNSNLVFPIEFLLPFLINIQKWWHNCRNTCLVDQSWWQNHWYLLQLSCASSLLSLHYSRLVRIIIWPGNSIGRFSLF